MSPPFEVHSRYQQPYPCPQPLPLPLNPNVQLDGNTSDRSQADRPAGLRAPAEEADGMCGTQGRRAQIHSAGGVVRLIAMLGGTSSSSTLEPIKGIGITLRLTRSHSAYAWCSLHMHIQGTR